MAREAKPTPPDPEAQGPGTTDFLIPRPRRWGRLALAGILLCLTTGFAVAYFWSPHVNLRVTTGPPGTTAERFITAFTLVSKTLYPRVHLELVQVNDLVTSAKDLEEWRTDLAIVRSDVAPANGQTVMILR